MAGGHHLAGKLIDRALDTTAGYRTDDALIRTDEHARTRGTWGRAPRPHDGPDTDRLAGAPPGHQLGQNVTHAPPPSTAPRTTPASARRQAGQHVATPPRYRPGPAGNRTFPGAG